MKKFIIIYMVLIVIAALSGCQTQQTVISTLTITDSVEPSPLQTRTYTDTPSPLPTNTISPTSTFSTTPDPTSTEITFSPTANGATLTSIPRRKTMDLEYSYYSTQVWNSANVISKTLVAKEAICPNQFHFAPYYGQSIEANNFITNDDKWTVINCMPNYDDDIDEMGFSRIFNYDNSKIWTISYESLELCEYYFLNAIYTDAKREFIYFTPKVDADVDGFFELSYFGSGGPIFQLDLQTGDVTTITRINETFEYFDWAFSPDAETIVLATSEYPHTVQFMHTMNGQIYQTVELSSDISRIGSFVWTKDQKHLIYMAGHDGWETVENGISIYRLDLETMENVELVHNDMRMMAPISYAEYPYSWIEGDILFLRSIMYMNYFSGYENYHWQIDIQTGEILDFGKDYYWY